MATFLQEYTTEDQRSVVCFLWAKGLNAKDIRKEMFLVYDGKFLSRKVVHNRLKKNGKFTADDEEVEMEARK
jgi:predicted peroxiredoxin